MVARRLLVFGWLVLFALFGCAGCSRLAERENAFRYNVSVIEELATKAYEPNRSELTNKKKAIEAEYAALPSDKSKRSDDLARLNERLTKLIEEYRPRIEPTKKLNPEQERISMIVAISGRWVAEGMELTIGTDGAVTYTKQIDGGVDSLKGTVTKIDARSFTAGTPSRVFWVDKAPYTDGSSVRMRVDGVDLLRTQVR